MCFYPKHWIIFSLRTKSTCCTVKYESINQYWLESHVFIWVLVLIPSTYFFPFCEPVSLHQILFDIRLLKRVAVSVHFGRITTVMWCKASVLHSLSPARMKEFGDTRLKWAGRTSSLQYALQMSGPTLLRFTPFICASMSKT